MSAVQDTNDGNSVYFDMIEDQIAAKYPAANASVFVVGNQRKSEWVIRKLHGRFTKARTKSLARNGLSCAI